MLGLQDYGSDDDSDNDNLNISNNKTKTSVSLPLPPLPPSAPSSSSSSSITTTSITTTSITINDKGKKVKKLDFSILPKEIQEALARNDDDDDSDEDSKSKSSNNVNNSSSKGVKGNLLSLLPKPKNSIETNINDKTSTTNAKSKGFNYVSLSETTINKKDNDIELMNSSLTANDDNVESDDETDANPILFDINTYNKPQQSSTVISTAAVSSSSSSSSSSSNYTNSAEVVQPIQTKIAWDQYYANQAPVGPTLPSDQQMQSYNYNYNYDVEYQEAESNQQLNQNHKRKRERDIEQLLLNGNVDVLNQLGNVQEINKVHQWNQADYLNQKEMAKQIHQQYSIDKAGMTNVSSVQSKRHQINSLAHKAAETELALLDSRANLSRNKQQAKQKYGW